MKMKKYLLFLVAVCSCFAAAAFPVKPEAAVIVIPEECGKIARFAAEDLQKHLRLITGCTIPLVEKDVPGKFSFKFTSAEGLQPEEARWEVTTGGVIFAGDDVRQIPRKGLLASSRTGTISAVADFLERQLNVRWITPGDDGIYYIPSKVLELKPGSGRWIPRLLSRQMASDYPLRHYRGKRFNAPGMPESLHISREEFTKRHNDYALWCKHQRLGSHVSFSFGHAFTQWYGQYGKSNPEYFALVKGKREPVRNPSRIKMCVSNPALHRKIVELWAKQSPRPHYINVCENDSGNFCECSACRALDVTPAGGKWDNFLSDRYFYFANEVLKLARQIDPEVEVCIYAYSRYKVPPAKTRVSDGIIIGFVPSMLNLEQAAKWYSGWRKAGIRQIFLRPNDNYVNTGLPMGMEKQLFQGFKLGLANGIIGTHYDACHGFWHSTGVADYILLRAHISPEASFEELFDHYCSGFGNAAPEIREYYTYWRENVWEKRLMKHRDTILEKGKYGNFARGIMWNLGDFFNENDFITTGRILDRAAAKAVTPVEKKLISQLQLVHRNSQLTIRAIIAPKGREKRKCARELLKFREENQHKLNTNLIRQTVLELQFGDISGIGRAAKKR